MSQTYTPHARAQEVLEMIIDTLRTNSDRLHGHKVVLFGSRARGSAKSRSDFDLGVVGQEPLPLEDFLRLKTYLTNCRPFTASIGLILHGPAPVTTINSPLTPDFSLVFLSAFVLKQKCPSSK